MKVKSNNINSVDCIIVVDNNVISNLLIEKKLQEGGFSGQIKMSLNGGHALLYLEHLHLSGKMKGMKLLILLNVNMPIMNGLEFLGKYNISKSFDKENIMISVIQDDLSVEKTEKVKKLGINYFLPRAFSINYLSEMISKHSFEKDRSELIINSSNSGKIIKSEVAA